MSDSTEDGKEPLFTWGDTVRVSEGASEDHRPGNLGAVCGLTEVTDTDTAATHGTPVGSFIYTVEYADGTDAEIPESYLKMATDER